MHLKNFEYMAPESIEEALYLAEKNPEGAHILAGGTDLLVAGKLGTIMPKLVISLRKIEALKDLIYHDEKGMIIGPLTSINKIACHTVVREKYPALAQAAALVGAPQLQYMGTIGGNICLDTRCYYYNQTSSWRQAKPVCFKTGGDMCHVLPKGKRCFAVFSADTPPALIAYDAKIKLVSSKGERTIPVKDFYTGEGKKPNRLLPGEILSEIHLPPSFAGEASMYLKYRTRGSIDFPLAGVAAMLAPMEKGDGFRKANVVLNAVESGPVLISVPEDLFIGPSFSRDVIERISALAFKAAHPVANADSTPEYRREMAAILTGRAFENLSRILEG